MIRWFIRVLSLIGLAVAFAMWCVWSFFNTSRMWLLERMGAGFLPPAIITATYYVQKWRGRL